LALDWTVALSIPVKGYELLFFAISFMHYEREPLNLTTFSWSTHPNASRDIVSICLAVLDIL
jgi:hypothetical protein